MDASADLVARARAWIEDDPDPATRAELADLLDRLPATRDELADRFSGRLEFGTAGLRAAVGAGPMRMNRAVVRQAAAGLAAYLRAQEGGGRRGVAVGFDARHGSAAFAEETVGVLAGAGLPVHLLPRPLPTPVLAFAVRHLGVDAGVMVTASHNPPADNGYKVYLADGAQIVPPADRDIAAAIAAVGPLREVPLAPLDSPLVHRLGQEVIDAYVEGVVARRHAPHAGGVRVAYTPMHGVGLEVVEAVWARAGFPPLAVVARQAEPDPDFPTVAFPNPEEPGAMDLLLEEARRSDAELALANDPDADRLAAAVPDRSSPGGWRVLRGDEVGWLLAAHVLRHTSGADRLVACSLVSSSLLGRMAEAEGVHFVETLTGFKWIARAASSRPGTRFTFGYEEALGYDVHDLVHDKDGISAAVALTEAAALAKAEGRTLLDELDAIEDRFGVHLTAQVSPRFEGLDGAARRAAVMDRFRSGLRAIGGRPVVSVRDLAEEDPPADVVVVRLAGDARVIARPSGTEPKVKVYLEVVGTDRATAEEAMRSLQAAVEALVLGS